MLNLSPPENWNEKFPFLFNRNPIKVIPVANELAMVSEDTVAAQPAMKDASLERALELSKGYFLESLLKEMEKHLIGDRLFVFVDVKVQYMKKGQYPSPDNMWHIDGGISLKTENSKLLYRSYDMFARDKLPVYPRFLSFISGDVSETEYMVTPRSLLVPRLMKSWILQTKEDFFVDNVEDKDIHTHKCNSIISYDAFTLHRAVPAKRDGWRLHVRIVETNTTRPKANMVRPDFDINMVYE